MFRVYLDTAYFAENWKYCSKIIFKCENSVKKPIFNEKVAGKKKFMSPVNSAQDPLICTVHRLFCWCEQYTNRQNKKETLLPKNKKSKR